MTIGVIPPDAVALRPHPAFHVSVAPGLKDLIVKIFLPYNALLAPSINLDHDSLKPDLQPDALMMVMLVAKK
ncbi:MULTISPECIES: hypothetical protein [Enterobacteriaceae]|uniref:hypothetical protein n=1 Tax=Enterobacteriaceae TaxID=543 RepID=UPI00034ED5BC|nr:MULTISPECIES: hypothetical protein [Enterobacteriaceae]AGN86178.1 hypothetical protein H650_13890 [Enterobacter sp. R4-368]MCZ3384146.1 hypothetical protein [Kosakonia sp. SOY2]QHM92950.1 hypothetical protein FGE25_01125 [Kosakonia sacchari]